MCVCVSASVSAVYVVLVTDILVLLTERDQKYRLATLQEYRVRSTDTVTKTLFNTIIISISVHKISWAFLTR